MLAIDAECECDSVLHRGVNSFYLLRDGCSGRLPCELELILRQHRDHGSSAERHFLKRMKCPRFLHVLFFSQRCQQESEFATHPVILSTAASEVGGVGYVLLRGL